MVRASFCSFFIVGLLSGTACPMGQPVGPSPEHNAVSEPKYVMTWKPETSGCDDRYIDGMEVRSQFTSQAGVMVNIFPDLNELSVHVYVSNPEKGTSRIEVVPEAVKVFRSSDKGLIEVPRVEATKIARALERRQRVRAGLDGFSAAMSQTTTTATSSDGTTTTVTTPNTQAQADAISRAHQNISAAQNLGAEAIQKELKRNTLEPGQTAMGRLYFAKQKTGTSLLIQIDIGDVRYQFPFLAPKP